MFTQYKTLANLNTISNNMDDSFDGIRTFSVNTLNAHENIKKWDEYSTLKAHF